MDCVKEVYSHQQMSVLVREGINHTLEKKAEFRSTTGKLFSKLVQEKFLTEDKFLEGCVRGSCIIYGGVWFIGAPPPRLNEVLEFAEDICIDIPQFWNYLGQVLAPPMAQSTLSLSLLSSVPPNLVSFYSLV